MTMQLLKEIITKAVFENLENTIQFFPEIENELLDLCKNLEQRFVDNGYEQLFNSIEEYEERIQDLQDLIETKDFDINGLKDEFDSLENEIEEYQNQIESLTDQVEEFENKIEELEKEIRNLESKKTLSRNDSLTIYKKINEEKKYQKVINMLDSLKKADNTMYNILLDESSNRYFDLNIDNQTDILSNEL